MPACDINKFYALINNNVYLTSLYIQDKLHYKTNYKHIYCVKELGLYLKCIITISYYKCVLFIQAFYNDKYDYHI